MKSFLDKALLPVVVFQFANFAYSTEYYPWEDNNFAHSTKDYPRTEMGYKYSESHTNLSNDFDNEKGKFRRKSNYNLREQQNNSEKHYNQCNTVVSTSGKNSIEDTLSSLSVFAKNLKIFIRPTFHRSARVTLGCIKFSLANIYRKIKRLPVPQIPEDDGFDHISSIDCIDALLSEISTQVRNLSNPRINRSDNFVQENTEHNLTLEATVDSILRSLSKIAQKVKDLSS